jgi:hypothetical protein
MERQRVVEDCERERSWAQSWEVLATNVGTDSGKSRARRDRAAGVGAMTMGRIQDKGFKLGRVRARHGRPGSIDNQVEQTLARGWALRPESARAVEVVKERIDVWKAGGLKRLAEMVGGRVATSEAG